MQIDRRSFVAGTAAVLLAGCLGESDSEADPPTRTPTNDPGEAPSEATATATETTIAGTRFESTSAPGSKPTRTPTPTPRPIENTPPLAESPLHLTWDPSELKDEARSGGPEKDGIPSIDDPLFVERSAAPDQLSDGDPVFGLVWNGDVKAYPQYILVYHEICNDEIKGEPVSVTYCPLTGTVMGFLRGETEFGVSGRLINNNLVMYDREDEAWWPQVPATSIPGPWNESPGEHSLREFRLVWTTWGQWKDLHPDTVVLSEETGHFRNYGRDPYGEYNPKGGYYTGDSTYFPRLTSDGRFQAKRVVMGVRTTEGAAAFLKDSLRKQKTMTGQVGGRDVVAVYDARLDTAYVYANPEGTSVRVDGDLAVLDGAAYTPDSLPLDRVYTFDAMWFAWSGFYPETNVYE